MTRALITNDDGIHSPGLHALALATRAHGLDTVIAAPASEASGSSAAITGAEDDGRISVTRIDLPGLEGIPAYSVRAAPGLIALIAAHGAFGRPPDLVLSGVNRGANVGRAILHSGTVGAALTAGASGGRGLAVSLDVGIAPISAEEHLWERATEVVLRVIDQALALPAGCVLNVNVPNTGPEHPPLVVAPLAGFGIVQTTLTEHGDGAAPGQTASGQDARGHTPAPGQQGDGQHGAAVAPGQLRLTVSDVKAELEPESDAALLAAGSATVTAIRGVSEVEIELRL